MLECLVKSRMLSHLIPHAGAGIYVNQGDGSVPTRVLPNNGIVIARPSGTRIQFQCRSGSLDTGVGQLVDLDGNSFNIGQNTGVFSVGSFEGDPDQLGSLWFRSRVGFENAITAADEGVYTCRIPDENGSDVDVNIGIYRNGFNSELWCNTIAILMYANHVIPKVKTLVSKVRVDMHSVFPSLLP